MIVNQENEVLRETEGILIRRLDITDRVEFIEAVNYSSDLLYPWVLLPSDDQRFDDYFQRFDRVSAECLLVCIRKTGAIAGTISISDIRPKPYMRGTLGYNAFEPHARRGYMAEGMRMLFRFAFEDLGLHRLEADIQPTNLASLSFAKKLGFQREGFSPSFAYVDGAWRDHDRWAITNNSEVSLPQE